MKSKVHYMHVISVLPFYKQNDNNDNKKMYDTFMSLLNEAFEDKQE